MTYLLAIETSSVYCSVALFVGTGKIADITMPLERGHAIVLVPMIKDLMDQAGISFAQLTHVAVGRGPGSFTGLRVGMSAAQGISVSLGIPLKTVTTFEAMLEMVPSQVRSNVLILIDTKREDFYASYYKDGAEEISILTVAQVKELAHQTKCHVVIDSAISWGQELQNAAQIIPTAEGVGSHAIRFLDAHTPAELLYIRFPNIM